MSGLNPTGPSQPPLNDVYKTSGNAATKEPAEQTAADRTNASDAPVADQRIPQSQGDYSTATATSMARGVRGAGSGEDPSTLTDQEKGVSADVDAQQMRAPGEGEVADAVANPAGAGGGEPGMETDLDRKKAEQAPMRQKQKEEGQKEVDVGGVLGQRGGPANPVDKGNYPNSGSG